MRASAYSNAHHQRPNAIKVQQNALAAKNVYYMYQPTTALLPGRGVKPVFDRPVLKKGNGIGSPFEPKAKV